MVKVGDLLFTYETDKSTIDETSEAEGILLEQFAKEGRRCPGYDECLRHRTGRREHRRICSGERRRAGGSRGRSAGCCSGYNSWRYRLRLLQQRREMGLSKPPRVQNILQKKDRDGSALCSADRSEGRVIERDVRTLLEKGPAATYAASGAFAGAGGTGHWRTVCCCGYRNGSGSSSCSGRSGAGIHR